MNKIEVDPKLFITCRLCLDEMGQYQIVPQVQEQIKYCFDIEVEPFDGLPQLICKKCESILSQYAGIKQIFQEKQQSLKTKIKENQNVVAPNRQQQQDAVNSTQQPDSDNNSLTNKIRSENKKSLSRSGTPSVDSESCKEHQIRPKKKVRKRFMSHWKRDYNKYFVCRYCNKSLKEKRSMNNHLKRCHLIQKYENVLRRCIVKMNKIGSSINLTYSNDNVVFSRDKIINSKHKNYYVVFAPKSAEKCAYSDSSDDDFTVNTKKPKRRRLLSKSSNETLVIEENSVSKNSRNSDLEEEKHNDNQVKLTDISDIEFINIDDSDSTSTTSNIKTTSNNTEATEDETLDKPTIVNNKVIQNIISMCYNKYMKRLDMSGRNTKGSGNMDAFLQRKILSIGRKVVHDKGLNSTGLLRYMEHKDLDVFWIPKNQASVSINTTLREDKCNDSNHTWRNLNILDKIYEPKDFIDIFEKTASQKCSLSKRNEVTNVETRFVGTENMSNVDDNAKLNSNNVQVEYPLLYFDANNKTDQTILKNVPLQKDLYDRKVENSVLYLNCTPEPENQNMLTKLLNENPVANPKQLPKKSTSIELLSLLTNSSSPPNMKTPPNIQLSNFDNNVNKSNEDFTMPIITSTMSLANTVDNTYNNSESSHHTANGVEIEVSKSQFPRIKVKPVSELMPDKSFSQTKNSTIDCANTWNTNYYNKSQNSFIRNDNTPVIFMTKDGVASTSNVNTVISPSLNVSSQKQITLKPSNQQYVTMHTVEFPNKRTNSPFRYFQELLQIHNMILLDSTDQVIGPMSCLIKFKLVFQQESTPEVTLCLSLFCRLNTFCIRVKDIESKYLAIAKLPAYWQWEILKEFKGNIVPKLYENASKIGPDVLNKTTCFVSLLSSITFTKL